MTETEPGGPESGVSTGKAPADTDRFLRSPSVLWRRAGVGLLLARPGEEIVHISGSASVVWELLAEPITVDEAADILAEAFDEDVARLRDDLVPVIDDLLSRGLVTIGHPDQPAEPGADG